MTLHRHQHLDPFSPFLHRFDLDALERFLNRRRERVNEAAPTMMEKPMGPLITQLGMGLSFLSQHLEEQRSREVTCTHHVLYKQTQQEQGEAGSGCS